MTDHSPAAAFTRLYRENYERVLRYVARRIGDGGDAEELTCEVFSVAWAKTRLGTGVSTPWLFVTAKNLLANHQRSIRRLARANQLLTADRLTQSGPWDGNPTGDSVRNVLDRLPEQHREVLIMHYWDEFCWPGNGNRSRRLTARSLGAAASRPPGIRRRVPERIRG